MNVLKKIIVLAIMAMFVAGMDDINLQMKMHESNNAELQKRLHELVEKRDQEIKTEEETTQELVGILEPLLETLQAVNQANLMKAMKECAALKKQNEENEQEIQRLLKNRIAKQDHQLKIQQAELEMYKAKSEKCNIV